MRVSWEEFWRARAVLGLLLGSLCAAVAQVSPCPAYFNYTQRNGGTVGEIELPAEGSGKHVIRVRLSVKTELPTRYRGEIELVEEKGEHIRYLLRFPLQSPLPKVTSISHDSKILCRGEPEKLDGHGYAVHNWGIQYPLISKISLNQKQKMSLKSNSSFPCGIPRPGPANFIVHGMLTAPGDWPWLVTVNLERGKVHLCTGVLVSSNVVLTAAQCVHSGATKRRPAEMLLECGVHDRLNNRDGVLSRYIRSIELPKDYKVTSPPTYDLAALILIRPVTYSNTIIPVCLWSGLRGLPNIIATGERGSVVGWGLDELDNPETVDPRLIKVPVVDFATCRRSHEIMNNLVKGLQYCAGTGDGLSGVCNGDAGGGMYFYKDNHWELKGIVSFGINNARLTCDLNEYTVFTDVTHPRYADWIVGIIEAESSKLDDLESSQEQDLEDY